MEDETETKEQNTSLPEDKKGEQKDTTLEDIKMALDQLRKDYGMINDRVTVMEKAWESLLEEEKTEPEHQDTQPPENTENKAQFSADDVKAMKSEIEKLKGDVAKFSAMGMKKTIQSSGFSQTNSDDVEMKKYLHEAGMRV